MKNLIMILVLLKTWDLWPHSISIKQTTLNVGMLIQFEKKMETWVDVKVTIKLNKKNISHNQEEELVMKKDVLFNHFLI